MKTPSFAPRRLPHLGMGLAGLMTVALATLGLGSLSACSSTPKAAQAAPLPANPGKVQARLAWRRSVGTQGPSTNALVQGAWLASSNAAGQLLLLNSQGQVQQQAQLQGAALSPAGSDGQLLAAVSQDSQLQVFKQGQLLWRQRLSAQSYTAPVVAGERVFVLQADRTVVAFDAATGQKLWHQQRAANILEALVLRESGTLQAVGNVLVAGIGSHLQGIDPDNGQVIWDKTVATSRSTNDVERLADVVGPAWRDDHTLCVRAYQAGIACLDVGLEQLQWAKKSAGQVGLGGDAQRVYSAESDGRIRAYARADGQAQWLNEQFLRHPLSAPVSWNGWLAVGDQSSGHIYWLDRNNGQLLGYQSTDSSGIKSMQILGGHLLVLNKSGQLQAFAPTAAQP